ncbi:hypothetical protein HF521_021313 [Silurus meridionalis]|uniref:Uncharacterized protein n=1 Tax=Silurus meridionalis TaxID=175797 RepID=A0A8T0BB20_SILME|nr:hypothetical protein HF521_021313 [Silurus meridionalis]
MSEVVVEIGGVTLQGCHNAKALLTDYDSLRIIVRFKPEKIPHDTGRWRQDTASVSSKQLVPCEDSVSSKQLVSYQS